MRRIALAVLLISMPAGAWLVFSSVSAAQVTPQPQPEPGLDEGELIYRRDCAWCHGARGEGTNRAPTLQGTGAAYNFYMVSTGRMPIDEPHQDVRRGPPAYDPDEIQALVDYISTIVEGPEVPVVRPALADLARGGQLYRIHCAACHGATGVGTALPSGAHAPPVRGVAADEIATTLVVGPGQMPVFVPPFDQEEVDAVVGYILSALAEPESPGGIPLFFVGPVPEGAVALFVGLFALILIAGWIGKRSPPHGS